MQSTHPRGSRTREAGFTLFEISLTMFIIIVVMAGVLKMFDVNSDLARVQTHVANMQQSLRVAQYDMIRNVRMTARGPLPQGRLAAQPGEDELDGLGLTVRNNVAAAEHIANGDTDSPLIAEGTDVLTIRGVLNGSLYQFNPAGGAFALDNPTTPTEGTLTIIDTTPTGLPQDLRSLADAVDLTTGTNVPEAHPEALIVVSPLDDFIFSIVELDNQSSYTETGGVVTQVDLSFKITGGVRTDDYQAFAPYPIRLQTASFAGVLEEYRYYIRELHEVPGDPTSRLSPRLSRARFYPGTEIPHREAEASYAADIADNILDLQVSLGIDTDNDGLVLEVPDGDDDWLYNSADDDDEDAAKWVGIAPDLSKLFYVRINTLARTDRQDRGFLADLLDIVEDKNYSAAPGSELNNADQRAFRRRWMQTTIDTRNVS